MQVRALRSCECCESGNDSTGHELAFLVCGPMRARPLALATSSMCGARSRGRVKMHRGTFVQRIPFPQLTSLPSLSITVSAVSRRPRRRPSQNKNSHGPDVTGLSQPGGRKLTSKPDWASQQDLPRTRLPRNVDSRKLASLQKDAITADNVEHAVTAEYQRRMQCGKNISESAVYDDHEEKGDTNVDESQRGEFLSLSECIRLKGREFEKSGQHAIACQLFHRCVELEPRNGKGWQDFAKAEGRRWGSLRSSARVLTNALRRNPRNAYLWQSLGFLEFRMGHHETARSHFLAGLARDPEHTAIYATWAFMESSLGNYTEARDMFEKAASMGTKGARVFHTWGHMELKLGNVGRAQELFQLGLDSEPDNPYIWHTLGNIAKDDDNVDQARTCYERALENDANNVVVLDDLGRLEAELGNEHTARTIFQRGVDAKRDDARILHSWSLFEYQGGCYLRARDLIQAAVKIARKDPILWNHCAKVEVALENFPRARALFKRASEVDPNDWMTWDNWSAMEHKLGNADQAKTLLEKSFRLRFNAKGAFTILANNINDRTE